MKIGSGTRAFDYATLLDHPVIDPDAFKLLVQAGVEVAGPTVLRACFARVALDLVHFLFAGPLPLTEGEGTNRVQQLADRARVAELLTAT